MQAMVLEIFRAYFAKRGNFQILDIAQIKKFQKYDPPKVRFLMPNKVPEAEKSSRGPKKQFLSKKWSFLPMNKYGISEPHENLLHWNLSWALLLRF